MADTKMFFRSYPGGPGVVVDKSVTTGNFFWVDSGASGAGDTDGHGTSPDSPFATLKYAYSSDLLTANNSDIVYVMPGHAEAVISAALIACDIEGVTVIGIGKGGSKPTITFTTIDSATMTITAANTHIENIRFVCDIDALVVGIPVTAADVTLEDCDFIDLGTDNSLYFVSVSAAGDRFRMINCTNYGTATAGNDAFLTIGATDDVEILNLRSHGDFVAGNIECTAAPVNILIEGARLENLNASDVCIEGFAAATGLMVDCLVRIATDGQVTGINTPGATALFACYQVNNDGESGLLIGAASV